MVNTATCAVVSARISAVSSPTMLSELSAVIWAVVNAANWAVVKPASCAVVIAAMSAVCSARKLVVLIAAIWSVVRDAT